MSDFLNLLNQESGCLLSLPNELLFEISTYLSLSDLIHVSLTCKDLYYIFGNIVDNVVKKMPWRICVDFARNSKHQTIIHTAWIKIGWFSYSYSRSQLLKYGPTYISDLLEECCTLRSGNPVSFRDRHYMLVRTGKGGPILNQILKYGKQAKIHFHKGYLPTIIGLLNDEQSDQIKSCTSHGGACEYINANFLIGECRPSGHEINFEEDYKIIKEYGDNYVCEEYIHKDRYVVRWKIHSHILYEITPSLETECKKIRNIMRNS